MLSVEDIFTEYKIMTQWVPSCSEPAAYGNNIKFIMGVHVADIQICNIYVNCIFQMIYNRLVTYIKQRKISSKNLTAGV